MMEVYLSSTTLKLQFFTWTQSFLRPHQVIIRLVFKESRKLMRGNFDFLDATPGGKLSKLMKARWGGER
jgi:hypothetical protein